MGKILISTSNKGKLNEFKNFLSILPVEIASLQELNIDSSFEEIGMTYKENSQAKALYFAKKSGLPTIADDGGIEIDYLGGGPGIKSRRYFGKDGKEASDEEIIDAMKKIALEIPEGKRNARFIDVVSFALPDGRVWSEPGEVEGIIAKRPLLKILSGYPYRSFFFLPEINKYYHEADLTPGQEKQYNHRYIAVQKLLPKIRQILDISD